MRRQTSSTGRWRESEKENKVRWADKDGKAIKK
jgi:hypothetical protein